MARAGLLGLWRDRGDYSETGTRILTEGIYEMKTITVEEMQQDYDWQYAFHEAVLGHCKPWTDDNDIGPVKHVVGVVACDSGQNDEMDWIAVVEWSGEEGAFAVMRAGCDYTGWDCQAGGSIEFCKTREEALSALTLTIEERTRMDIPLE